MKNLKEKEERPVLEFFLTVVACCVIWGVVALLAGVAK